MDNSLLLNYSDSLVLSKILESPISHNPFPYDFSKFVDCECLVCSSTTRIVAIRKISIPPISIILRTEEPRCDKHMFFVRCSFCKDFFDLFSIQNSIKKPTRYPAILCSSHRKCVRCKNCGKWADSGDKYCHTCQRLNGPIKGKHYRSLSPSLSENLRRWTLDKMACQGFYITSNITRSPTLTNLHEKDIKLTNVWTDNSRGLITGKT